MKVFGLKENQIEDLLKKHDEQYILANIQAVEERVNQGGNIKNVSAYLMSAFENDYREVETEYSKEQEEKKALALEQEQAEQEEKEVMKRFENKFKNDKVAALDSVLN